MAEQDLIVERRDDDIVLITLNRPRAANTVSVEMWERFSTALDEFERSPPRAVVLCGAEGRFSNGGDVRNGPAGGSGPLANASRLEQGQRVIARLRALPCPTIAAVERGAHGIGWSLALACDMLFADEDAQFSAPFIDYGTVPDGGGAWFLVDRIGRQRTAEIYYSGRSVPATEALTLGLAARLYPGGTVVDEALSFASGIGKGNRQATELTKRLMQAAADGDLASVHALELAYCHIAQGGEEVRAAKEAMIARSAAKKAGKAG